MKDLFSKFKSLLEKNKDLIGKLFIIALILTPFALSLQTNIVQSYTDFFIKGSKSGLDSYVIWNDSNFGSSIASEIWRLFPLGLLFYFSTNVLNLPSGIIMSVLLAVLYLISYGFFVKTLKKFILPNLDSVWAVRLAGLFYIFNTFSLVQVSNSFLLVLPFLLLPVQLYVFLRGLYEGKTIQYGLLLGLINGSVFGVNLIFDVIAMALLAVVGLINVIFKKYTFRQLTLLSVTAIIATTLVTFFWITPQLSASLSDKATTSYVLSSESFYNLDSSIGKVLRGLGDWGFFASNAGVPYYNYSPLYRDNLIVVIAGFLIPVLILLPLILKKHISYRKYQLGIYYFLLLLVTTFIGGTHDGWLTSGLMQWAFDHIPYFQAFRNTYKFASLQVLFGSIILAFSIFTMTNKLSKNLYKSTLIVAVLMVIVINAFPYFTGRLYSSQQNISSIPSYWSDMSKYVNNNISDASNILMLPDQYFEVFNWDGGLKGFPRNLEETLFKPPVTHNTCKGCGSPNASSILQYAYSHLDDPTTYQLLGNLGVGYIMQRNDYAWQYYKVQSPATINSYLATNPYVKKIVTYGKLDLYKINTDSVNEVIYSPKTVIETSRIEDFTGALSSPSFVTGTGFAVSSQLKNQSLTNSAYYKDLFSKDTSLLFGDKINDRTQITHSGTYSILKNVNGIHGSYAVSYTSENGNYSLKLTPYSDSISVDGIKSSQSSDTISNDYNLGKYDTDIAITINNKAYLLKDGQSSKLGSIDLVSGKNPINVYSADIGQVSNQLINGSFENGLWQKKVLNCKQSGGDSSIKQSIVNDSTVGRNALELSASKDVACIYSPSISQYSPGLYYYAFDSKHISGNNPSYCVWDGKGCQVFDTLGSDNGWTKTSGVALLNDDSTNINLYLYSDKANYPQTINRFDNVQIFKLGNLLDSSDIDISSSPSAPYTITMPAGNHTISNNLIIATDNLVSNGSFEDGLWQSQVTNCSGGNDNTINMASSNDSIKGKKSLELTSNGDTACTSSASLSSFSSDKLYKLSLSYKVIEGEKGRVCVWDGNSCVVDKDLTGTPNKWQEAQVLVTPSRDSRLLSVYLYAPQTKGHSKVLYDDIQINQIENNFVNSYTLQNSNPVTTTSGFVSNITKFSNTKYMFNASSLNSDSLIYFQQSFNSGWVLTLKDSSGKVFKISPKNQFIANGYGNGWILQDFKTTSVDKIEGTIEYSPQSFVPIGIAVSAISAILAFIGVIILHARNKKAVS